MDYFLHLLILIGLYSILAISLNYAAGFTGILSLSHATFFGVGAYATGILTTQYGFSFIPSVFAGMTLTAVISYLASFPILKLREDAFVLVSFGFAIIAYHLMLNWGDLTGGALGVKGILAPTILGYRFFEKPFFLALVILVALATYFFFRHIVKSPYGIILKSIRENPTVASVSGHSVKSYQRNAFVLSAVFASIAGSLMATFLSFIEPKLFDLMPSVIMLIMVILGGLGNLKGSVLGAAILLLVPELLRFIGLPHSILAETQQMIYGIILVILMFVRPQGILGEYKL